MKKIILGMLLASSMIGSAHAAVTAIDTAYNSATDQHRFWFVENGVDILVHTGPAEQSFGAALEAAIRRFGSGSLTITATNISANGDHSITLSNGETFAFTADVGHGLSDYDALTNAASNTAAANYAANTIEFNHNAIERNTDNVPSINNLDRYNIVGSDHYYLRDGGRWVYSDGAIGSNFDAAGEHTHNILGTISRAASDGLGAVNIHVNAQHTRLHSVAEDFMGRNVDVITAPAGEGHHQGAIFSYTIGTTQYVGAIRPDTGFIQSFAVNGNVNLGTIEATKRHLVEQWNRPAPTGNTGAAGQGLGISDSTGVVLSRDTQVINLGTFTPRGSGNAILRNLAADAIAAYNADAVNGDFTVRYTGDRADIAVLAPDLSRATRTRRVADAVVGSSTYAYEIMTDHGLQVHVNSFRNLNGRVIFGGAHVVANRAAAEAMGALWIGSRGNLASETLTRYNEIARAAGSEHTLSNVPTSAGGNTDGVYNFEAALSNIDIGHINAAIDEAYGNGYEEGYADGFSDGFADGFRDGVLSAK